MDFIVTLIINSLNLPRLSHANDGSYRPMGDQLACYITCHLIHLAGILCATIVGSFFMQNGLEY